MSKPKFKVGDKVRILNGTKITDYAGGWAFDMKRHIGEIATIKHASQISGTRCYRLEEFGFYWDERGLELVKPEKIIIYHNGAEVVAKNITTGKTGVARCNPADEFDFNIGAKLALERLTNPEPEKPKYYSGKVVCVDDSGKGHTKGKIYRVENGSIEFDSEHFSFTLFSSIDDINSFYTSQFIELVE